MHLLSGNILPQLECSCQETGVSLSRNLIQLTVCVDSLLGREKKGGKRRLLVCSVMVWWCFFLKTLAISRQCLFPGIGSIGNCIISLYPDFFSPFSEQIIPYWEHFLNGQWHHVSDIMSFLIEMYTNWMVEVFPKNISPVVSQTVTESPTSLTHIHKFSAFATADLVHHICGHTGERCCDLP